MQHNAINVVALIIIASFAVERITSGLLFLLSFFGPWRRILPDSIPSDAPEALSYRKRQKAIYYGIAGIIVLILILTIKDLSLLSALGISAPRLLDFAVSWLVLIAGSDRIFELISRHEVIAQPEKQTTPLIVTGTLTIEPDAKTSTAKALAGPR